MLPRSMEVYIALLGISSQAPTYVPLDPGYPRCYYGKLAVIKIPPQGVSVAFMMLSLMANVMWARAGHLATEYVEGDVIVTFKRSVTMTIAQQTLASHSLVFQRHFAELSRHRGKETGLVRAKNRTTAELIAD